MANTANNGSRYTLTGKADAPVIVLIHGLGLTRDTWKNHLPALEQSFQVLNYDLYGHGESAAPPEKLSLTVFAQQLRELLDELNIEQVALVGFSLGGMINRRFAMDYPDRVSALVIFNSPHERGEEAQKRVEAQASSAHAGGPGATLSAALERWFTAEFRQSHLSVITQVSDWILANDPEHYAQARWVLANGVVELIHPDPPITHPTLVMTCEYDSGSTPAMSQSIVEGIDGSQLHIIPQLQHMGLVEQPELFYQPAIEFLQSSVYRH